MTTRDHEDFDRFMNEAVPAVQAQHISAARKLRDDEHAKAFEELFGDQVLAVYQRSTPSEQERLRHYKRFRAFQAWVGEIRMPYHGATAGLYLFDMLTIQHKSVADLKAAAASIKFVHEMAGHHIDGAFIEAALAVATEIANGPGDDGGGETADNPPPPPADYGALPLAAGA